MQLAWRGRTQVTQAPLSVPKASAQAGSSAWKNSSGWKKVRRARASSRRKASTSANNTWRSPADRERAAREEVGIVLGRAVVGERMACEAWPCLGLKALGP
jgi:hypothetical protein